MRGGPTRVPTRVARPYPGRHFTDVATSPVSSRESACESRPPEKHSVRQRDAGSRSGSPQWSRDTSCFQYPAERACGAWPASSSPPSDLNRMRLAQVSGTQVRAVPHAARARCSLKPAASESSVGRRAGLAAGGGLLLASPPAMAGTLSDSLTGTFFEGATTGDIAVQVGLVFAFGLLLLLSGGVRTAQTPCFSA